MRVLFLILLFIFNISILSAGTRLEKGKPWWYHNPNQNDKRGSIGIDKYGRREKALENAIDEIAKQKRVSIDTTVESEKNVSENRVTSKKTRVFSKQYSGGITIKGYVMDSWVDPETKFLYLWVLELEGNEDFKRMRKFVEINNKTGYYVNLSFGQEEVEISNFKVKEKAQEKYKFNQEDRALLRSLLGELGTSFGETSIFLSGKIYFSSPIKIYSLGLGLNQRIFTYNNINVRIGGILEALLINGKIGEVLISNYDEIDDNTPIDLEKTAIGIIPYVDIDYDFNKKLSAFARIEYKLYNDDSEVDIFAHDYLLDVDEFEEVVINLSGMGVKLGLKYNF